MKDTVEERIAELRQIRRSSQTQNEATLGQVTQPKLSPFSLSFISLWGLFCFSFVTLWGLFCPSLGYLSVSLCLFVVSLFHLPKGVFVSPLIPKGKEASKPQKQIERISQSPSDSVDS